MCHARFFSHLESYSKRNPTSRRYQILVPLAPRIIICHALFFIFRIILENKSKSGRYQILVPPSPKDNKLSRTFLHVQNYIRREIQQVCVIKSWSSLAPRMNLS
jgi:hypothetical protein